MLSLGAKAPPRTKIPYTRLLNSIKKRRKNTATTEITVNSDDKGFDGKEKERKHTTIKRYYTYMYMYVNNLLPT